MVDESPRLLSLSELARERAPKPRRKSPQGQIDASAAQLGGKAARLVWLVRNGFRVPDARVVPASVFEAIAHEVLPPGHDVRSLLRLGGTREGVERAGRAHALMRQAALPLWLLDELGEALTTMLPSAPWGLAIRSSATCEDSAASSLAGLAVTRLGVRGLDEAVDALREVFASLLLPRALGYLVDVGVNNAAMAAVIQAVVPALASGVAATSEPPLVLDAEREARRPKPPVARVAERRNVEVLVNATHGLGAPLVGGVAPADVLRLRAPVVALDAAEPEPPRLLDLTIAHKTRSMVIGPSGAEIVDVASDRRDAPAIDEAQAAEVARAATRLLTLGPGPWELEFAFARERADEAPALWLLQARPVVESPLPEGGAPDTVWSCANLAEALPGVATPLTWSIAASFSELGFRRAFAALGCFVPRGTRFVANVQGRFYLNLTAFMRVAAAVPGLDPATLLELGGGEGAKELAGQVEDVSRRGFYARLPLTAARLVGEQARLDDELAAYERDAERQKRGFLARDLGILTDDGVATTLRDLQRFLDRTGALMLTCASSSLGSFVALRALLSRVNPKTASRLAEDLTSGGAKRGFGELDSARPTTALARLAEVVMADPAARAVFAAGPSVKSMDQIPPGIARDSFARWLEAYGDRAIREAELSTPRWREDPSFPLSTLTLYVRRAIEGKPFAPDDDGVDARADEALVRVEAKMRLLERTALRHLVARCRKFARLRERMRAWVTWVLGAIRVAALEADRRLHRRELTAEIGDVFFLTLDEVLAALRGEPRAIGRIVAVRRAEHARDLARPDPPNTFVGRPSPVRLEALGGPVIHGHGGSPGVVKGPVRILATPDEADRLLPGEILVTRTTDVGWTPLFLAAAGVVTELGGPLSHAAIVARELGVPAVINAQGATFRLRDGDLVRLDGDRGLVEIVPPPGETA